LIFVSGINGATYNWSPGGATTDSIYVSPTVTQIYTVAIVQGVNHYRDSIKISIIPPISASISTSHDSICPGLSVVLTASAHGGQATYKWNTGATTSSVTVTPTVTTSYTATVYGICDSVRVTSRVIVIPLDHPVLSGKDSVCRGGRDTLTVGGGTYYLWNNGSTRNVYYTGKIQGDSTFYVTAFNSLGCAVTDSFKVSVDTNCSTGITEINNPNEFLIYPNPSHGVFTIQSPVNRGRCSVEIYNVLGEKAFMETLGSIQGDNLIGLGNKSPGLYFYRVISEDGHLLGEGKILIE